MDNEQMPKVNLTRDAPRLTISDLHHMKRIEEENLKRVIKFKRTRFLNRVTATGLVAGVIGIYSYTIWAVKQEKFLDDFDEPEKISDAQ